MADVPLMNNPMTTAGDVIQGGASGAPSRLAIGTAGQILKVNAGATALEYGDESGGGADPLGYTTILKAADQDVVNAQNTDDTDFQFAVTAGKIYMIEALFAFSTDTAAADAEWRYATSAGTMDGRGVWIGITTADSGQAGGIATTAAANSSNQAVGSTASDLGYPITGRLALTVRQNTSSGTFKIQFGNNTTGSGRTTRMLAGSYLRYKQIN